MPRRKTWREKLADSNDFPRVQPISPGMAKTWGEGTIVIPQPSEVDAIMRSVPKGKLTTINQIRASLAKKHGASIGCPITTGIFAGIAARAAGKRSSRAAGKCPARAAGRRPSRAAGTVTSRASRHNRACTATRAAKRPLPIFPRVAGSAQRSAGVSPWQRVSSTATLSSSSVRRRRPQPRRLPQ